MKYHISKSEKSYKVANKFLKNGWNYSKNDKNG